MNIKQGGNMTKKKNGRKRRRDRVGKQVGEELKALKPRKGISEFGRKIDFVCAERDLNDSDLARISGISRQAIYNLKRSEYPKGTTIYKIAKALHIPVSFFFEEGFSSLSST